MAIKFLPEFLCISREKGMVITRDDVLFSCDLM